MWLALKVLPVLQQHGRNIATLTPTTIYQSINQSINRKPCHCNAAAGAAKPKSMLRLWHMQRNHFSQNIFR